MKIEETLVRVIGEIAESTSSYIVVGYSKAINSYLIYMQESVESQARIFSKILKAQESFNSKGNGGRLAYRITSFFVYNKLVDYQVYPYDIKTKITRQKIESFPIYQMLDRVYEGNNFKFPSLGYLFSKNEKAAKSFQSYLITKNHSEKFIKYVGTSLLAPKLEHSLHDSDLKIIEDWLKTSHKITIKIGPDSGYNLMSKSEELLDRDYYSDKDITSKAYVIGEAIKKITQPVVLSIGINKKENEQEKKEKVKQ